MIDSVVSLIFTAKRQLGYYDCAAPGCYEQRKKRIKICSHTCIFMRLLFGLDEQILNRIRLLTRFDSGTISYVPAYFSSEQDFLIIRSTSRQYCRVCLALLLINSMRTLAAKRPISLAGTLTVVRGGSQYAANSTPSNPTSEMSPGTWRPACLMDDSAPMAKWSLTAKTAVGGSGRDNI